MADGAVADGAFASLQADGLDVIRGLDGGCNCMRAAVAGFAVDTVVAAGVAEQRSGLFELEARAVVTSAAAGVVLPGLASGSARTAPAVPLS